MECCNTKLKICSINVWGLHDDIKRRKMYLWLEENRFDVTYLQETHFTKGDIEKFNNGWSGDMYHSVSNSRHGRGVAIALSKRLNYSKMKCNTDNDGRRILLSIEHGGCEISLVNLYAPNDKKERKTFFSRCLKWINKHNKAGSNILVGGDMNCCINDNDRQPATHLQDYSRHAFRELINGLDLFDCWNDEENGLEKYTWCSPDQRIKSRLDYILIGKEGDYKKGDIEIKLLSQVR
jgi:exodeoxyribonuclease-3